MTPSIPKFALSQVLDHSPKRQIGDTEYSRRILEHGSLSRAGKTKAGPCLHEDMHPSFSCEGNGGQYHFGEEDMPFLFLTRTESKSLNRKALKRLSNSPCTKRARKDQPNDSVPTAGPDDHDAKKIGYDHISCISDEKCRMFKHKRGQDGKRIDKKIIKASVKTKFDPYTSKVGFITPCSASGRNDIVGIYGLKSDIQDVTNHTEELSLGELLDGSYKYANLSLEKAKRASNGNETILLSVRNACSVLPLHGAAENIGNRASLMYPQNPNLSSAKISDRDEKDECIEELSCKALLSTPTLLQPKDILEQLALPPIPDLEAVIFKSNPSESTMHIKDFCTTSLPPFPWSFPLGGTCKTGIDSCKLSLSRSASQSKWVRIGSSFTLTGDDRNFFSEHELRKLDRELKTLNLNDDSFKQKNDEIKDVKLLTEHIMPDQSENNSECHTGSGAAGLHGSNKQKTQGDHAVVSDSHVEYDKSKDNIFHKSSDCGVGLWCLKNEFTSVDSEKFDSPVKGKGIDLLQQPKRTIDGCSGISDGCSFKSSAGGCGKSLLHQAAPEISNPDHSPKLLAAAAILCEISRHSCAAMAQNDTITRVKRPKSPSPKSIKDRKSAFSIDKAEMSFMTSRHHDTFKRAGLPSTKQKLYSKKKSDFIPAISTGREPVRWSLPPKEGGASPPKQEPIHLVGSSTRPPSSTLMPAPTRFEKANDHHHQMLARETPKASPYAFGGTYLKDWNRGRNKRV